MATYVNNLRLKEITTGDEDGTWGTSTNTNLELITDGFSYGTKQLSGDANQTFTMPDATADATRGLYLKITSAGSLTATREVTLGPNTINKVWIIENATTGGQSITIKQGSGATVEIATTATQMLYADGAGAGAAVAKVASAAGGVSYVTKTANYTTKNLEGVLANTTGGAFTVTLPASPSAGDQVVIADSGNVFGTNNCIAGRNGSTIEGTAADLNLNINGVSVQFVYSGSTWEVYSQVGGNGGSAVTLTGTQTLTNKTISYADNTLTGVVGVTATQTLTNKTLTSPKVNENVAVSATATELNVLDGVTATTAEINYNDITTLGTSQASKVLTADANGDVLASEEFKAKSYNETYVAMSANDVNCEAGNFFSKTISGNTTFTFSNPPASGTAYGFVFQLTSSGTNTVTYPSGVDWAGGTAPDAPASGETDILCFITHDAGTTWYGFLAGDAIA